MTVERESPEATICGLLIVRNTLSLSFSPPILPRNLSTPGLFTYLFVFDKVTNNLDKFHSPTTRDREAPNPPQSPNATRFPPIPDISRRRHDLVVAEAYTSSLWR